MKNKVSLPHSSLEAHCDGYPSRQSYGKLRIVDYSNPLLIQESLDLMIKGLTRIILIIVLLVNSGQILIGQPNQSWAKSFLLSMDVMGELLQKELELETIISQGNLRVIESSDPPCYLVYKIKGSDCRVLAYSLNHRFDSGETNSGFVEEWLKSMHDISVRQLKITQLTDQPVGPLLRSAWAQGKWYNRFCPVEMKGPGRKAWAGCIAVAMGQIIRHYGYSNDSTSFHGYQWERLLEQPVSYSFPVSRLLAKLGEQVGMNYGYQSSSASSGRAHKAFQNLGYSECYRVRRSDYRPEEWAELFIQNLLASQPILVAGGGHAFVCDGIDSNGFLHFNLGGAGIGDGYYASNMIYGYSVQEAIVNIVPDNEFEPPAQIREGGTEDEKMIFWEPPQGNDVPQYYRVYSSDLVFVETKHPVIAVSEMPPGLLPLRVTAVYPGGESVAAGPLWVFNPGELIHIDDAQLFEKLEAYADTSETKQAQSISEGRLARIKKMDLDYSESVMYFLKYCTGLQKVDLMLRPETEADFKILKGLGLLQSLCIRGLSQQNIDSFYLPDQVVSLHLSAMEGTLIDSLNLDKHICELVLEGLTLTKGVETESMTNLVQLEMIHCNSSNYSFLSAGQNLTVLRLNNTNLSSLELDQTLPNLSILNLNDNKIIESTFMQYFPNIQKLCLSGNLISSLDFHNRMPELMYVEASDNQISNLSLAFDYPILEVLILDHNQLTSIPSIYRNLPGIKCFNLSYNQLSNLSNLASHSVTRLDLGYNQLTCLPTFKHYLGLQELILRDNPLSDLWPLVKDGINQQIKVLDLRNTALSKESFEQYLPELSNLISDCKFDSDYEGRSPCFLTPQSGRQNLNTQILLEWDVFSNQNPISYDILVSTGRDMQAICQNLLASPTLLKLDAGQHYTWQVRAIYEDTVFFSGQRCISTFEALELPFSDGFETYAPGANITTVSRFWRLTNGSSDIYEDAEVTRLSGTIGLQALHLSGKSNILLDLDHIEEPSLYIGFSVLPSPNKTGCWRLLDLGGMNVEINWSDGNGRIQLDQRACEGFQFSPNVWLDFNIRILARSSRIFIYCQNELILNHRWQFKDSMVTLDAVQFGTEPGSTASNSLGDFYIDEIELGSSRSTAVETSYVIAEQKITAYPNPARDQVNFIGFESIGSGCRFQLFDLSGRLIFETTSYLNEGQLQIDISQVNPGWYLYKVQLDSGMVFTDKLVISRN